MLANPAREHRLSRTRATVDRDEKPLTVAFARLD
jgi:hypothetical protein